MRNLFGALLALVVVFGLGLGLAFGGGALYGRKSVKVVSAPTATAAAGAGAAGAAGGLGGGTGGAGGAGAQAQGGAAGGGQGRAGTAGVVEKIDGNNLTLRTQTGSVTVTLASDTEIRQTVAAQATDLKPGQTVTVLGTPGADGNIQQARSITITPAGAGAGGAQGQGGAGQGQGGPPRTAVPATATVPPAGR